MAQEATQENTDPTQYPVPLDMVLASMSPAGRVEFEEARLRAIIRLQNDSLVNAVQTINNLQEQTMTLDSQVQALMGELHGVRVPDQGRSDRPDPQPDHQPGAGALHADGGASGSPPA